MKRFVLLSLPLLAVTTLASAQTVVPPKKPVLATKATPTATAEERADALTTNMAQVLSLTPAQTEKVRAINATAMRSGESARQRYGDDPTKLRSSIEDITLARLDRLKDALTPAQFNRYQQKREEKMGIQSVKGYQGTPPPGLGSNGRGGDE